MEIVPKTVSENGTPNLEICRLCLAKTLTHFSLIEDAENVTMLRELTSITIFSSDTISTRMCLKCKLNLKLAFNIQQGMLKAAENFSLVETKPPKIEITENSESIQKQDLLACPYCLKKFASNKLRNRHKREVHSSHVKCDICRKEVKEIFLKKHLEAHQTAATSHSCAVCGKTKPSKMLLKRHMENVHTAKVPCPICSKLVARCNLVQHTKSHKAEHRLCHICGVSYKVETLRKHIVRKHTEGATFKCQHCDKQYQQKTARDVHEKKEHEGNPDYVCETCGKKFFARSHLNKHKQIKHDKLRPFVCEFCNVGFCTKMTLATHRRQHTNETPYKCELCPLEFRQRVSLKTHLRSKHQIVEELTEECKVCGKKFGSKAGLDSHSRIH